jgi:hypothetical protein
MVHDGWTGGAGSLTLPATIADLVGNTLGSAFTRNYTVDATPPTLSANPPNNAAIDWKQSIVINANESLSALAADTTVSGTLTSGATYTKTIAGTQLTLTLTGGTTWAIDSNQTLSVTVKDLYNNAATINLTYNVLDGAVYVRPPASGGNDTFPGTRSQPKATISSAITQADAVFTIGEVHVAIGSYSETLTIPAGISVIGGYDIANWNLAPLRSRTTQVTDAAGAVPSAIAVTLSGANTGLSKMTVRGDSSATSSCTGVQINAGVVANVATVDDNDVLVGTCPTQYAVYVVQGTVTVSNSTLRASNGTNTYAMYIGGGAVTVSSNKISGGQGTTATYGIYSNSGYTLSFIGNVIHAGTPPGATGATYGIYTYATAGNAKIANNWISGGGNSTASSQQTRALYLYTGTNHVLNNTLHSGTGYYSVCVENYVDSAASVENNICILKGYLTTVGKTNIAFTQRGSGTPFLTMKNNNVYDYGDRSSVLNAFAFMKYNTTSTGNCPSNAGFDCYPLGTSPNYLDDETVTTGGGAAGTADSNVFLNPAFVNLNGADGAVDTLFDASMNLENNWALTSGSAIKALGLDGTSAANNYGFTTDRPGVTRTGNGTTGWSIGADETD